MSGEENDKEQLDQQLDAQQNAGAKEDGVKEKPPAESQAETVALLDKKSPKSEELNVSTNLDNPNSPQVNGSAIPKCHEKPRTSVKDSIVKLALPIMFEGERPHSLLRPRFSNPNLELQYRCSYYKSEAFRFQAAMIYFVLFLSSYLGYFIYRWITVSERESSPIGAIAVLAAFIVLILALLVISYTPLYNTSNCVFFHYTLAAVLLALPLFTLGCVQSETMANSVSDANGVSPLASLTLVFIVFIILYTVTSIPVMVVASFGFLYSFTFELLYFTLYGSKTDLGGSPVLMLTRFLLHLCVHLLGVHFSHFYSSRKRELFNKKGRAILASQEMEKETEQMKNLIYSVMPVQVATYMMEREGTGKKASQFRDLYVEVLDDVSILFADIVGFTNMSSGKTAEELLDLLNDLYGRFDKLAEETGCEKIATLGDCYYCVAGCPTPQVDHARCTINMGLAMIQAIKEFDEDRGQSVQMRVGIHTGKVICGVVGTKRHKFDILSDDVFIANDMESSGEPSAVHISEYTKMGLEKANCADAFILKEFKPEEEKSSKLSRRTHKKTYLVSRKFTDDAPPSPTKRQQQQPKETPPETEEKKPAEKEVEEEEQLPLTNYEVADQEGNIHLCDVDQQLISLLIAKPHHIQIFKDTPINLATLCFKGSLESDYKDYFRRKNLEEVVYDHIKCTAFIYDLLPTFTIFLVVALCFILAGMAENAPLGVLFWVALVLIFVLVSLVVAVHLFLYFDTKYRTPIQNVISGWFVCHLTGILMLMAPVLLLFSFPGCSPQLAPYFFYCSVLLWIHFANYPRLSTLAKVIMLVVLVSVISFSLLVSVVCSSTPGSVSPFSGMHEFGVEIVLQYVLLVIFVWLVSMDFETMIRANFHADVIEKDHKKKMIEMHEMTQTKLSNIMPQYVMDHFSATNTRVYSASRENVGIIFFFVDFWASYSEDYKDGAEYIRLLNELVSDFDALLLEHKYRNIEKIKTISSTYMAASNLDPNFTDPWMVQLCSLMEFTLELKKKLILFCQDIPGQSTYISKGGINYGDVTAGVIGTSKLHFDIWGDAVNVSSRMYSTGDSNMIQMTEKTRNALVEAGWPEDRFKYRKKVFVKGKGDMDTHHYTRQEENEDMQKYYANKS